MSEKGFAPVLVVTGRADGRTAQTGGIEHIHSEIVDNRIRTIIDGTIKDPIVRTAAPRFERNEFHPAAADLGLPGYHKAHLWGPGFGDEAFEGIAYAPEDFNLTWQNSGIEGRIRDLAQEAKASGSTIHVKATVETHSRNIAGGNALASVTYEVVVHTPGLPPSRAFYAELHVDAPPSGRVHDVVLLDGPAWTDPSWMDRPPPRESALESSSRASEDQVHQGDPAPGTDADIRAHPVGEVAGAGVARPRETSSATLGPTIATPLTASAAHWEAGGAENLAAEARAQAAKIEARLRQGPPGGLASGEGVATIGNKVFVMANVGGLLVALGTIRNIDDLGQVGVAVGFDLAAEAVLTRFAGAGVAGAAVFALTLRGDQGEGWERKNAESEVVSKFLEQNFTREEIQANYDALHKQARHAIFEVPPWQVEDPMNAGTPAGDLAERTIRDLLEGASVKILLSEYLHAGGLGDTASFARILMTKMAPGGGTYLDLLIARIADGDARLSQLLTEALDRELEKEGGGPAPGTAPTDSQPTGDLPGGYDSDKTWPATPAPRAFDSDADGAPDMTLASQDVEPVAAVSEERGSATSVLVNDLDATPGTYPEPDHDLGPGITGHPDASHEPTSAEQTTQPNADEFGTNDQVSRPDPDELGTNDQVSRPDPDELGTDVNGSSDRHGGDEDYDIEEDVIVRQQDRA